MPEHKKGESRKDWMNRCVPYVIKREGLSPKNAAGKCGGMYDQWKKKQHKKQHSDLQEDDIMVYGKYEQGKYYSFKFDSFDGYGESTEFNYVEFVEKATSQKGFNMVIAIGNRFMKGVYVSKDEMKSAYRGFNNTLHDLNHMGSGYMMNLFSVVPSDISYIVGWQDSLSYDDTTNEVRANVHIEKTAPRYSEWKNYIDISAKIGRTPNVSMFVYGKIEYKQARELPTNSGYRKAGYKADDLVPCMTNIMPFMVSTVTRGTCDDKKGCGIKQSCDDGSCALDKEDNLENETMDSEQVKKSIEAKNKQIKYFKDRIKSLKGEK